MDGSVRTDMKPTTRTEKFTARLLGAMLTISAFRELWINVDPGLAYLPGKLLSCAMLGYIGIRAAPALGQGRCHIGLFAI